MTEEQINDEQRTETDLMQFVPKVHFEQIPIRNLVSNQEYQRNLSQHHVKNAASHFDLYQINPVKVSRRDGINYVFNGQHTIEIVALVSGSRETPVWCMVYDDLEYEHEADIFANQMKYVKPLLPYEIFMANIEAGNDKQLIIRDLVESYDLTITSTTAPGGICAVATLENIHDKYGYHMLDHVIRLIAATWEGASQSFSANHGEPPAITSTTGRFSPCSFVMSPMCFISGNRYMVTAMGNFSISLAHTGRMPFLFAANGNPPIPSNRLPSFFSILSPPYAATALTTVFEMLMAVCAA